MADNFIKDTLKDILRTHNLGIFEMLKTLVQQKLNWLQLM